MSVPDFIGLICHSPMLNITDLSKSCQPLAHLVWHSVWPLALLAHLDLGPEGYPINSATAETLFTQPMRIPHHNSAFRIPGHRKATSNNSVSSSPSETRVDE